MSTGLIIIACLFLIVVVVLQIGKVNELAAKIRGEEETQERSNKNQGIFLLAFLVAFMVYVVWTTLHFWNWMMGYGPHESASAHGGELDSMFNVTAVLTGIVFIITHILLFWFGFKYYGRRGVISTFIPHDNKLEVIWTAVPAVVMCFLVIRGLVGWNEVMADVTADDEATGNYMEIEAAAMQFAWNLRYPGDDNKLGERNYKLIQPGVNPIGQNWMDDKNLDDFFADSLVVPVGKKIRVRITALDVLHNFDLPHFRVKMDAVPGMPTYFIFTPITTTSEYRQKLRKYPEYQTLNEDGVPLWKAFDYELACAELCGKGHFSMRRTVVVVSEDEYATWAKRQKSYYMTSIRGKDGDPRKGEVLGNEQTQRKQDFETSVEKALAGSTEADKTIRLNNVNFETNSANLTAESTAELDYLVGILNKYPKLEIEVAGHTDDTGEDAANLQLSQDRAAAVAAYLTKTKGIAANRITAKGYGETKPLKPNDSEPNKAENRRTEFRIIKQ